VAQAKLSWWLDEFAQRPRHPLTLGLADASGGAQAAAAPLREACAALLRLAQVDSIESLDQLLEPLSRAAAALSRARGAPPALDARALAAARLVFAMREWVRFDVLARVGVDRSGAVASAPVALALLRRLREVLDAVPTRDLRGIDGARVAAARAWAARMAGAPLSVVDGRLAAPRIALVFALWRVGRRR
jgi:hypothetical protein